MAEKTEKAEGAEKCCEGMVLVDEYANRLYELRNEAARKLAQARINLDKAYKEHLVMEGIIGRYLEGEK